MRGASEAGRGPVRAVVFPGQGSQRPGMGEKLFHLSARVRSFYRDASDMLGMDVAALCFRAPPAVLTDTSNAQIAVTVTNLASYELLREADAPADLVAGHSVGELSAVAAAGSVATDEVLRAVALRAELMGSLGPGGVMQAVTGCSAATVEATCAEVTGLGPAVVAVYNTDRHVVVSGSEAAVDEVVRRLRRPGVRVARVAVSHAFHSPLMAAVVDEWRAHLDKLTFARPTVPIVANITGEILEEADAVRDALVAQVVAPVRWAGCLATIAAYGVDTVVEAGDSRYLARYVRQVTPLVRTMPLLAATGLAPAGRGGQRDAL